MLALRSCTVFEKFAAGRAMDEAGAVLLSALKTNVSARDHTARDLAKLDHPYAARHGAIRIHKGSSEFLAKGTSLVHSQSGALLAATYLTTTGTLSTSGVRVGIDDNRAPHARFVVQGTRVMLPRDVVNDTANAPGTQRAIMRTVVKVFGAEFKAQAGIRFTAAGRSRALATSTSKKF